MNMTPQTLGAFMTTTEARVWRKKAHEQRDPLTKARRYFIFWILKKGLFKYSIMRSNFWLRLAT